MVAVFSLADVLLICGRVGGEIPTFVLDSKIVAEADVFAESVEDMFPSFKCMVFCDGLRRDGNHETHTRLQVQRMGDALFLWQILVNNGKEWHSRSTSTRSNVREMSPRQVGSTDLTKL